MLNPLASPTLTVFDDRSGTQPSHPRGFVAYGTGDPAAPVKTIDGDSFVDQDPIGLFGPFAAGPTSPRLDEQATETKPTYASTSVVPVAPSGDTPGTGLSGAGRAPALVVATRASGATETVVHRLVPDEAGGTMVEAARSAPIPGVPGPQPALTQNGQAPGDGAGLVLVPTGKDLVALDGGDLSVVWRVSADSSLQPGGNGFSRTAPVVTAGTVFAVRDDGHQMALRLEDGALLAASEFDPFASLTTTVSSFGSPAATEHGIVVVAGDRGVFAYRARCANGLSRGTVRGTLAGDLLTGTAKGETFDALAGADCIDAGDGADVVAGGEGADEIDLGPGIDSASGGPDNDHINGAADADRISGQDGDDRVEGGFGRDILKGGPGNDVFDGGPDPDRIFGDEGDDKLIGGAGADRLSGGAGRDNLRGGKGDDTLIGGSRADRLVGGAGVDHFSAGPGDDTIFSRDGKREIVRCGKGRDQVRADRVDRLVGCELRLR
jgi:hypothetical protein